MQEYSDVATENDVYVAQEGTSEYLVIQFKNQFDDNTGSINIICKARSDLAPMSAPVYLQIYNRTSGLWETIDTDNSSSADTKFTLSAAVSTGLSNYYDGSYWVACRIYQEAI